MVVVASLPGQVDLVDCDPVGPQRGPHVGEGGRQIVGVFERRPRDDQVGLIAQPREAIVVAHVPEARLGEARRRIERHPEADLPSKARGALEVAEEEAQHLGAGRRRAIELEAIDADGGVGAVRQHQERHRRHVARTVLEHGLALQVAADVACRNPEDLEVVVEARPEIVGDLPRRRLAGAPSRVARHADVALREEPRDLVRRDAAEHPPEIGERTLAVHQRAPSPPRPGRRSRYSRYAPGSPSRPSHAASAMLTISRAVTK